MPTHVTSNYTWTQARPTMSCISSILIEATLNERPHTSKALTSPATLAGPKTKSSRSNFNGRNGGGAKWTGDQTTATYIVRHSVKFISTKKQQIAAEW